jgi:hypothetical protein
LPVTVQAAPLSNCKVAKLVMLLPSKPDSVPALALDASSMTLVLFARLLILPVITDPGSRINRLADALESNSTAA